MKTKGATSHIELTLEQLTQKLSPTDKVLVGRRWAKAKGLLPQENPSPSKTVEVKKDEISIQFIN